MVAWLRLADAISPGPPGADVEPFHLGKGKGQMVEDLRNKRYLLVRL